MDRSLFQVLRMDCAAEASLVRMKLDGIAAVRSLDFDLAARKVAVCHEGEPDAIKSALGQIGLGSKLVDSLV